MTDRPIALITGASEGIGLAISQRLIAEGYTVAAVARQADKLRDAAGMLGEHAFPMACDIARPDEIDRAVTAIAGRAGRIDVLVNCASTTRFGNSLSLSDAEWASGFEVKVLGALRLMRAAWPQLRAAKGAVVNIGGIGARTPRDAAAMSGPLSAALMALTKVFADRGVADGVRVNMINPGGVLTPRFAAMLQARADAEGCTFDEIVAGMVTANQITRLGKPEDVAAMVAFLLSREAELLQGAIIDLDGGMTKSL